MAKSCKQVVMTKKLGMVNSSGSLCEPDSSPVSMVDLS